MKQKQVAKAIKKAQSMGEFCIEIVQCKIYADCLFFCFIIFEHLNVLLCSFRFYVSYSQASPVHERPQYLCYQAAELVDSLVIFLFNKMLPMSRLILAFFS